MKFILIAIAAALAVEDAEVPNVDVNELIETAQPEELENAMLAQQSPEDQDDDMVQAEIENMDNQEPEEQEEAEEDEEPEEQEEVEEQPEEEEAVEEEPVEDEDDL